MLPQEFQEIFVFSLSLREVIGNIMVALICGVVISLLYRNTYNGISYSASFANSIIMLTMITAVVIMVIGNNLARAFGLVGAMSIIRFRTAVKDAQDIMFIFFALAIGLSCGVRLYAVALSSTAIIGSVIWVIHRFSVHQMPKKEFLLQIVYDASIAPENPFQDILRQHSRDYKLVNIKAIEEAETDLMEATYYIRFKNEEAHPELNSSIKKIGGVKQVNLFFDEN